MRDILDFGTIAPGMTVSCFEEAISDYHGVGLVGAISKGRDIKLVLESLGIGRMVNYSYLMFVNLQLTW